VTPHVWQVGWSNFLRSGAWQLGYARVNVAMATQPHPRVRMNQLWLDGVAESAPPRELVFKGHRLIFSVATATTHVSRTYTHTYHKTGRGPPAIHTACELLVPHLCSRVGTAPDSSAAPTPPTVQR